MRWCLSCNIEVPERLPLCPTCHAETSDLPLPIGRPPEGFDLARIDLGGTRWIVSLSKRLSAAGIEHWIDYEQQPSSYLKGNFARDVYVELLTHARDADRAHEVRELLLLETVPDIPEGYSSPDQAGENCPACGQRLDQSATECPACGLSFPEMAED